MNTQSQASTTAKFERDGYMNQCGRLRHNWRSMGNRLSMRIRRMTLWLLPLMMVAGCASTSWQYPPGDIAANTQLAISPNGKRLLVSWNDKTGKLHSKLVELKDGKAIAVRDIALPSNTYTTAFGVSNDHVLITTIDDTGSDLLKLNVVTGEAKLIVGGPMLKRFPLEISEGDYVFLEQVESEDRTFSRWQRYKKNEKTALNPKGYRRAARLDVIRDALFIFEPWNPPAFRNIHGSLPDGLGKLISVGTTDIVCADQTPLICLRKTLPPYNSKSGYQGVLELFNGARPCLVDGAWIDSRELQMSRDGGTAVFHSAIDRSTGTRSLFAIKNASGECPVNAISLRGEEPGRFKVERENSANNAASPSIGI